jgi:hypothetical protein
MSEDKSEWTKQRWISWAEEVVNLTPAQKRMTKPLLIQEIEAIMSLRKATPEIAPTLSAKSASSIPTAPSAEIHRKDKRYTR